MFNPEPNPQRFADRLRLILLLDACEAAALTPISVGNLHALAFLANVLSPIWSVDSYDGKILKREGGPYYPELQYELDRLVGLGFVSVHDIRHLNEEDRWRLEGSFGLNAGMAKELIDDASLFADERIIMSFLRRLAYAAARLTEPLRAIVKFDATWSDDRTGTGDVIDFAEWRAANYSAFAAKLFGKTAPLNLKVERGDQLQLYMRLLARRAHSAA